MIFEAISTLKEPNGSDTTAIVNFIEVCLKNAWKLSLQFFLFQANWVGFRLL